MYKILNVWYTSATPTFDIEVFHLIINVQLLKHLLQWNKQLKQFCLSLFRQVSNDTLHFVTKFTSIIIINLVSVGLICRFTELFHLVIQGSFTWMPLGQTDRQTDRHTYSHHTQKQFQETCREGFCTWFKKILFV